MSATDFRIADTFTASLMRLSGQEQKAVKTTAFDLQLDPTAPGLKFHKLDRAWDPDFWAVRVTADLRIIVHKTAGSLLLCHVGHHDDAYRWAERRRLVCHPTTGAAPPTGDLARECARGGSSPEAGAVSALCPAARGTGG